MTYQELTKSREVFGLGERATLAQIKARHRELAKQFHPDIRQQDDPTPIRELSAAYQILKDYCENYQFSFSEEEFLVQVPKERIKRQFEGDPLWSGQD